MRPSSPGLADAFARGAAAAGADVTKIGLASTDQLYFASGFLGLAGAMFTASHNPAAYNGIKLCRSYARPVGMDTGLAEIRDRVEAGAEVAAVTPGSIAERDVLEEYAAHLLGLAPVDRPPAQGRGRRGQRDGRAHRARGAGSRRRRRRPGAALLRARRHLPQPRRQPARRDHAGRPPGGRPGGGSRRRARLRRRRGPLLPRRREGRGRLALRGHRADRHPRARQGAGRHDHPQPDHQPLGPRDRARARRQARAHEGRPLRHQGPDGRDRRDLRRRALRPLLLPRLLAGGLRACSPRSTSSGRSRPSRARCRR